MSGAGWGRGAARACRIIGAHLRLSVLAALQYRVGFWTDGLLAVFWSVIGIVPLWVAVEHRGEVVGWGPWELMVLTGCFTVVAGLFGAFLQPALIESMHHIRRGTLDYVLLRPADGLLLCLLTAFRPWRLIEVAFGLGLVGVSLWQLDVAPSWTAWLLAGVMGLASVVVLYGLGVLTLCLSFRAQQLQNLTYLLESVLDFSRWPIGVFGGLLKALFTFVIPLAVLTSYPAGALLGREGARALALAVAIATLLSLLSRLAWRASVRAYTSASS